jgi:4-amino-4-deoxy-L-arabinose transferase-like glycosyltransferase
LLLLSLIGFFPFLGKVHLFDWDEVNFAECAREMLVLQDFSRVYIDYKPFWEKPPLFFWLQAGSMYLFGVNEFAARFPNALCGLLTLQLLFWLGKKLIGKTLGFFWGLAYFGSFLPHFYFKSGIIDPFFNLFIFTGLVGALIFYWKKSQYDGAQAFKLPGWFYLGCGGAALGLALLTKGPVALLIICLCLLVYWARLRFKKFYNFSALIFYFSICFFVFALWHGWEYIKNGTWFFEEFFKYQYRLLTTEDAGHGGFLGFHFVVLLLGCFPASIFALAELLGKTSGSQVDRNFQRWMLILLAIVLVLFSIVQSKIVHYSSLAYFPITFLAARSLERHLNKSQERQSSVGAFLSGSHDDDKSFTPPGWQMFLLLGVGLVWAAFFLLLPAIGIFKSYIIPYIKDPFAVANLGASVQWSSLDFFPGAIFLLLVINVFLLCRRAKVVNAAIFCFLSCGFFINLFLYSFVPRIERYTQGSIIDFYKSIQGKYCYVKTLHFKSYAHYFYAQFPVPTHSEYYQYVDEPKKNQEHLNNWLLFGEIDRDVYFVTKIMHAENYRKWKGLVCVFEKNGFIVFLRKKGIRLQLPIV